MKKTIFRHSINFSALLLTDTLMIIVALSLSNVTRLWLENFPLFHNYDGNVQRFTFEGLLFVFQFFLFYLFGLYSKRNDFFEELRIIWKSVVFLFIFLFFIAFVTKTSSIYSRPMVMLMFVNMLWLIPLGRLSIKLLLSRLKLWQINAYIEGRGEQHRRLKKNLRANNFLGYNIVPKTKEAKVVFIATKDMPLDELEGLISKYKRSMKEVIVIPYLSDISFSNADIIDLRIGRMSMLNIQNQLYKPKNIIIKKVSEFALVLLMLPILVIVYAFLSLIIKLDSRGCVLFRQERMGKDAKPFTCYKFRTMYTNGDEILEKYLVNNPDEVLYYEKFHKYKNDPRITRAGKFLRHLSLDELPQMINVIKGDMNLIGPRPYLFEEEIKLGNSSDTILHVAPGITGFWQINGRNELSFEERVVLDSWYIQNWSLWLDFIIFMKTFIVLLNRRGAQ